MMTKAARIVAVLVWLTSAAGCGGRPPATDSTSSESTTGTSTSTSTSTDATSTESGTSGGTESGTESGTETGTFVPDLPVPLDLCDPFLQDCDEGEKCVPTLPTTFPGPEVYEGPEEYEGKCVPITGDQATGEPCTSSGHKDGLDNCDETSACWNLNEIDGELVGICHPMCAGTPDDPQCLEGSHCEMWGQYGYTLCVWQCDPLARDCGPGLACYFDHPYFSCFFPGDAPVNAPCHGIPQGCAEGLACINDTYLPNCQAEGCCSPLCDTDLGDGQCAAVPGTTCVPVYVVQPPPGYERAGWCLVPP